MNLRVLIADDERLARAKLRRHLAAEPDVEIVGECRNGAEAVEAIQKYRPDILFLDVEMPARSGFDVLAEVGTAAMAVIFVTAFDSYAVRAFEVDARDFLLKPFDKLRLKRALARARAAVHPLRRLLVRERDRIRFVPVEEIDWIEAADNYVLIHAGGGEHLLRDTLARLESSLDPECFVRIHRRLIVNMTAVVEVQALPHGEHAVALRCGARLPLGRRYRDQFFAIGTGRCARSRRERAAGVFEPQELME